MTYVTLRYFSGWMLWVVRMIRTTERASTIIIIFEWQNQKAASSKSKSWRWCTLTTNPLSQICWKRLTRHRRQPSRPLTSIRCNLPRPDCKAGSIISKRLMTKIKTMRSAVLLFRSFKSRSYHPKFSFPDPHGPPLNCMPEGSVSWPVVGRPHFTSGCTLESLFAKLVPSFGCNSICPLMKLWSIIIITRNNRNVEKDPPSSTQEERGRRDHHYQHHRHHHHRSLRRRNQNLTRRVNGEWIWFARQKLGLKSYDDKDRNTS